jgi:hypothetical protein
MKRFAPFVFATTFLAMTAFGQVPYQHPVAPPEPKRNQVIQPRNRFPKMVRQTQTTKNAKRGIKRGGKMKNGSK